MTLKPGGHDPRPAHGVVTAYELVIEHHVLLGDQNVSKVSRLLEDLSGRA